MQSGRFIPIFRIGHNFGVYEAAKLDANEVAQIVKKYQSLVCAITFSGTGRTDISEELAQETFVRAWKNLTQLRDQTRFKFWLWNLKNR